MSMEYDARPLPEFTIGDYLRKAREFAGLEQAELATELGISRGTVTNYEKGHVKPRKAVVMAWAMRTGVPVEWITSLGTTNPHQGGPGGGSVSLSQRVRPEGFEPPTFWLGAWADDDEVAA